MILNIYVLSTGTVLLECLIMSSSKYFICTFIIAVKILGDRGFDSSSDDYPVFGADVYDVRRRQDLLICWPFFPDLTFR